jgi:hypothetical protein
LQNNGGGQVTSGILRGMKSIINYSGLSEAIILKLSSEYDDFPVKKIGTWISHKTALDDWIKEYVARKRPGI